jgi:4'-phosphopantetheinyl transferase
MADSTNLNRRRIHETRFSHLTNLHATPLKADALNSNFRPYEISLLNSRFSPYEIIHRIHIWTISIGNSAATVRLEQVLDESENARAQRFAFSSLRDRFIEVRGALRCLLALYLDTNPSTIRLEYGPNGKPSVESGSNIEFNVSHSKDLAVVAITTNCRVGVDIEYMCELSELEQIASSFFRPEEFAAIASSPPAERRSAFFRSWTRKEAYVKALGAGFSTPVEGLPVTASESPAHSLHAGLEGAANESWVLEDLNLAPDYAVALAYCGEQRPLSLFPIIDVAEF